MLIEQRLTGDTAWRPLGTVTSAADGTFADSVQLDLGAQLRASIAGGQIRSATVAVSLEPALAISSTARRTKVGPLDPDQRPAEPGQGGDAGDALRVRPDTGGWRAVAAKPPGLERPDHVPLDGRLRADAAARRGRAPLRDAGVRDAAEPHDRVTATGAPPGGKNRPTHRC